MKRITDWAHDGLRSHLKPGDWAVDATLGNGRDALLLCDRVGPTGRVWGFDIQAAAIESARRRLSSAACFTAVHADHASMSSHLPRAARRALRAVVFNLGYLPGGDHGLTTRPRSTLAALAVAFDWLASGGVLCCTCYAGHPQGGSETQAVDAWLASLEASAARLTRIERSGTREPAPALAWLEKR